MLLSQVLPVLQKLTMHDCELTVWPKLPCWSLLTAVDLSHNNFTYVPKALIRLRQLSVMNLAGNRIAHFSAELLQLKQLCSLDLSRQRGDSFTIQESIVAVTALAYLTLLDFTDNKLTCDAHFYLGRCCSCLGHRSRLVRW